MSFIKMKGKQIRTAIKCKIQNWKMFHVHSERKESITIEPMEMGRNGDDNIRKNDIDIETEHVIIYNTIWNIIDVLANIVGFNVYKVSEMNFKMAFTIGVILVAYPSIFFTMVVVWPSVSTLLEVICIFGVLLPATLKFRFVLKYTKYMLSLKIFFGNVLLKNSTGIRAQFLEKEMKIIFVKVKIFTLLFLMCFAIFSLHPIYAFVVEKRLVAIMRIEFPFVDQTEMKGYLIGLAIMLLFGFLAVVGSVCFDLVVAIFLLGYGSLLSLLLQDIEDYHEMRRNSKTFSSRDGDDFLKNICSKYQDINCYIRYFNKLFAGNICHSICVLYGSLICSVYAVLNNGWISGYGFCIFCFVQLYILCILGTYVKDQNEKLNQALYFAPWYEYPLDVQKTFLILLHASSFNAVELWIGPFAPLNVRTGLQMTKNIYSYTTAMSNLT